MAQEFRGLYNKEIKEAEDKADFERLQYKTQVEMAWKLIMLMDKGLTMLYNKPVVLEGWHKHALQDTFGQMMDLYPRSSVPHSIRQRQAIKSTAQHMRETIFKDHANYR